MSWRASSSASIRHAPNPDQAVVYELAGLYLWDPPIFRLAYTWATERGLGTSVGLTSPAE